jgi:hypothetical protein
VNLKQTGRRFLAKWLIKFFWSAIRGVVTWEALMARQDECKHEGQTSTFCGLCGKTLKDEDESKLEELLERVVRKVISEPTKSGDKPRQSLAERLGVGKGKKK